MTPVFRLGSRARMRRCGRQRGAADRTEVAHPRVRTEGNPDGKSQKDRPCCEAKSPMIGLSI